MKGQDCYNCKKTLTRDYPLAVATSEFIACEHCGHDIHTGQSLKAWAEPINFAAPAQNKATAPDFLEAAAKHMRDRAAQRDAPTGERSMAKTVQAFNTIYNQNITEEQGWLFMALLKTVRSSQGTFTADDYEDGAAYFALAGEAASKERTHA